MIELEWDRFSKNTSSDKNNFDLSILDYDRIAWSVKYWRVLYFVSSLSKNENADFCFRIVMKKTIDLTYEITSKESDIYIHIIYNIASITYNKQI